jgi:hypothetical protein
MIRACNSPLPRPLRAGFALARPPIAFDPDVIGRTGGIGALRVQTCRFPALSRAIPLIRGRPSGFAEPRRAFA